MGKTRKKISSSAKKPLEKKEMAYIKFEYEEAIDAKRKILYLEKSFLNLMMHIKKYRSIKEKEIKARPKLQRNIKEFLRNTREMQKNLPEIKLGKKYEEKIEAPLVEKERKYSEDIESQLREIQNRISSLK